MLRRAARVLDDLVPSWVASEGPDMVRRVRTAMLLAWLMGTMFTMVLIARLAAQEWLAAAVDVGLIVACFGAPLVVKWTGRYQLVANTALAVVYALLCYLGVANGNPGLNAATVALAEMPLFAIIILGVRPGYAWSALCAIAVLVVGVSRFDVTLAPTMTERAAFNEYWAAVVMCLTLISAGLFYERGKDESLKRIAVLEAERREAEVDKMQSEADAKVRQAERFASMGRIAAAVAHEINNPLSYVGGNLEFLHKQLGASDEAVTEAIDESLEGLARIRTIVADLRALTRPDEPGEVAEAQIARAIDAAISMATGHTRSKASVRGGGERRALRGL